MPLPKDQRGVYGDPRADYQRARGALAGFTGLGDEPSVMDPEAKKTYEDSELAALLSNLIPGKGALSGGAGALGMMKRLSTKASRLDDGLIADYLPTKVQSMLSPDVGMGFDDLRKLFPKDWSRAESAAMADVDMFGLRNRYFERGAEYVDKLPKADRDYIVNYVAGAGPHHAYSINEKLRAGVVPEQALFIDEVMKKAPRAEVPFTMYRGQPLAKYHDPAYMSITKDRGVADAYADTINSIHDLEAYDVRMGHPNAGGTVKLILPERTPLVSPDVEKFFSDEEMLLPRGTRQEGDNYTRNLILPEGYAEGGLTKVSHSDLYQQRARGDQSVAPQEHRAFAREWTQDNPMLAVPSLLAAIPAYSAAKALGIVHSRTPASLEQMTEGYKGILDGLNNLWQE